MSKRTFIVFALLILVLAVVIPWLAFRSKGDADTGAQQVAANLKGGQELFQINCGNCHTLYAAGADGNYGPNLDELAEETSGLSEEFVLSTVENGADKPTTPGRMPARILNEVQAEEVAAFVAATAGEG